MVLFFVAASSNFEQLHVFLNDVCNDDNLFTQLIMRLPSVGCHDMCFSFSSELIQEFYIHFFLYWLFSYYSFSYLSQIGIAGAVITLL